MKRSRVSPILALLLLSACGTPDIPLPTVFTNKNGTLKVEFCSRGCEQYVLISDAPELATLYVMNMPDSLKTRAIQSAQTGQQLPVVFSGTRSDELEQISVAGPNDVPQPAYRAHRLQLTAIRRR